MYSLIFLAFTSCILSLLLTPLVRNTALRFGIVDEPDYNRKIHTSAIPRLGGVAIFVAALAAYGLLLLVKLNARGIVWTGLELAIPLMPAGALIFGIGLIDDLRGVRPWVKLAVEIAAAILVWLGGIHIRTIAGHELPVIISLPVTLVWIVACTNAMNLIDGVDGLAAGVGLFATVTTLIAALINRNINLALATVPLAGALLGFLRYNFNPASIFLGDCGSLTVGFVLGCYGVVWTEKSSTMLGMTAPLIALSLPLFDAALAIVRRYLRQQPIFGADRAHIHHQLLSRGMTPRRVALVLYAASGVAAAASLVLTVSQEQYRGFVLLLVCVAAWLGFQHLGYHEFGTAGKLMRDGSFRRMLSTQLALNAFEHEFVAATTLEQCWQILHRTYEKFGFTGIVFHLDNVSRRSGVSTGWTVRLDFPPYGYINLSRQTGSATPGAVVIPFVDCVSGVTVQKLEYLELARPRAMSAGA